MGNMQEKDEIRIVEMKSCCEFCSANCKPPVLIIRDDGEVLGRSGLNFKIQMLAYLFNMIVNDALSKGVDNDSFSMLFNKALLKEKGFQNADS